MKMTTHRNPPSNSARGARDRILGMTALAVIIGLGCVARSQLDFSAPSGDATTDGGTQHGDSDCTPGSCLAGEYCNSGSCQPCNVDAYCGASCSNCKDQWLTCDGSACVNASSCVGRPDFIRCTLVTNPDRSYDICVNEVCVSPGCGDQTCNVGSPSFALADTNQRLCYDNSAEITCPDRSSCDTLPFCGQDAQYGWDISNPFSIRFTRTVSNQPTVLDNITGLMWQGCSAGLSGDLCNIGSAAAETWSAAVPYCDGLSWGGHAESNNYWSFTHSPTSTDWVVEADFDLGSLSRDQVTDLNPFRCVRLASATVHAWSPRFTRTIPRFDQPVVEDAATELMWMGCAAGLTGVDCTSGANDTLTWQEAMSTCESSAWGGYSDWFLPNMTEVQSVADLRLADNALDPVAFASAPVCDLWSSTTRMGSATRAWSLTVDTGTTTSFDKLETHCVLCARREP